jgi:hypothetical protein
MLSDPTLAAQGVTITCQAPYAPWWHLPVGIFAVLCGLAGVLLALRGEMTRREKIIWIVGISLLTLLELKMIMWSDADTQKERDYAECQLQRNFQEIEAENQQQFRATMSGVGHVFDKTSEAADAAQDGIKAMTGSDSYLWIFPHGLMSKDDDGKFILFPAVLGKHIVWDAEIEMGDGPVDASFYSRPLEFFKLQPISTTHLAGFGKFIQPPKKGVTTYGFGISSLGPSEVENLQVRFNSENQHWEFQYWLYVVKVSKNPGPPQLIKHVDWTSIAYPMLR